MPHRLPQLSTDGLARRGVYTLPFVGTQGERYLVAVDHRGKRLAEATLYPGVTDAGPVKAVLEAILEKDDPTHLSILD